MPTPKSSVVEKLLSNSDVMVNGARPGDIRVHDQRTFGRILSRGSLGAGESYMDGWWDCDAIDVFVDKVCRSNALQKITLSWPLIRTALLSVLTNPARARSYDIGRRHYDIGNDFYESMLGPTMVYSCGYWKAARTLEEAQTAKLDLICRKLHLKRGQTLLDIGCGWGALAKYAAKNYGVSVTGITVSREQETWARELCKRLPVEIRFQDYRDLKGRFDRIVSVGMFEHVGYKNYRDYMRIANRLLSDNGLFLLHTIGGLASVPHTDPWINKYIFPHSKLPSLQQITRAAEGLLVAEDLENFGADYDKTLLAWYDNFERDWPRFSSAYGERFYKMWRFYLLSCAGLFRSRRIQLWQIVFSRNGIVGGYKSVR